MENFRSDESNNSRKRSGSFSHQYLSLSESQRSSDISTNVRKLMIQYDDPPKELVENDPSANTSYDADVDEDLPRRDANITDIESNTSSSSRARFSTREREHIYELFQPWALRTYGDQAKTKTITLLKKVRILKALEGKEHSRPDSSKFRFWVKSKAFTTKCPEDLEAISDKHIQWQNKSSIRASVPSENPEKTDLYVASTTKETGKRIYRKVAVVEEFFDIIYNVHMELGGRSGMHAGQKRTYRIITETYAFLPREAVTRFLSICPECKKNLRAISPVNLCQTDDIGNENSAEIEALNYSSHTESSLEIGQTTKASSSETNFNFAKRPRYENQNLNISSPNLTKSQYIDQIHMSSKTPTPSLTSYSKPPTLNSNSNVFSNIQKDVTSELNWTKSTQESVPSTSKIRVKSHLQSAFSPISVYRPESVLTVSTSLDPTTSNAFPSLQLNALKTQQSLLRYYEFMRRFYAYDIVPQIHEPQLHNLQDTFPNSSPFSAAMSSAFVEHNSPSLDSLPFSFESFSDVKITPTTPINIIKNLTPDNDKETMAPTEPTGTKLKNSTITSESFRTEFLARTTNHPHNPTPTQTTTQTSAIDLCKPFLFRSHETSLKVTKLSQEKQVANTFLRQSLPVSKAIPQTGAISNTPVKIEVITPSKEQAVGELRVPQMRTTTIKHIDLPPLDLDRLKPITSTYLQMTRSMGLSDEDALRFDNLDTIPASSVATDSTVGNVSEANTDSDPYAGLMKDADKLKLMLLAWNYQNSNAVRNGTEGPDLSVVGGLWAQYQNALAQNAAAVAASSNKLDSSLSPVPRTDANSPMEGQDETNSSGHKEEDEGSEDDSDDKLDEKLATHDPERLKAFNMFVRLFVDENLDRIVPISKQPKEKIQAIIDSCARQFPEFSDRSRKRIRTYLKSCRRNKKTRDGWDNTTRPTPAHLTSVQAEQILAIACENESMNAKRMRIGLEPITHAIPAPGSAVAAAAAAAVLAATSSTGGVSSIGVSGGGGSSSSTATSTTVSGGGESTTVTSVNLPFANVNTAGNFARSTPNSDTAEAISLTPAAAIAAASSSVSGGMNSARSSPLALSSNASGSTSGLDIKPLASALANGSGACGNPVSATNGAISLSASATSPLYRPTDFTSPSTTSPFAAAAGGRGAPTFPGYFPGMVGLSNATPTDLSMKAATSINTNNNGSVPTTVTVSTVSNNLLGNNNQILAGLNVNNNATNTNNALATATQQLQQLQHQQQQHLQQQGNVVGITLPSASSTLCSVGNHDNNTVRPPPLLPHKLNQNEITAARQVISAYRESAAFLLRTADQVEQLLVQQQQQ